MANGTMTVKRSPFILIRTFIAIEFLASICFLLLLGHGSLKYDIYTRFFFFSNLIPYDIAKFVALAVAQLLITIYAFIRWYTESYTLKPGVLMHKWGVFQKKEKVLELRPDMPADIFSGFFGKRFHYGSLLVKDDSSRMEVLNISHPEQFLKSVRRAMNPQSGFAEPDLDKILNGQESDRLEFKSSLRFDHKNGVISRSLEHSIMKTVAGFLNSRGGELVIGVNDEREPLGLLADYKTLQVQSSDGFENHFTQVFNSMIGPEFRSLVKLWFKRAGGGEVCVVQVSQSPRPVYLKTENNEHFYVRTGNITTSLKFSEMESYRRAHWGKDSVQTA